MLSGVTLLHAPLSTQSAHLRSLHAAALQPLLSKLSLIAAKHQQGGSRGGPGRAWLLSVEYIRKAACAARAPQVPRKCSASAHAPAVVRVQHPRSAKDAS